MRTLGARLSAGDLLPHLRLPEVGGAEIDIDRYKRRRNPVLFFAHSGTCPQCAAQAGALASAHDEIAAEEGQLLLVVPGSQQDARGFQARAGVDGPVLFDRTGETYRRFGVVAGPALFIANRFGRLYVAGYSNGSHALPDVRAVLDWLAFIEIQCPE